MIYQALGVLFTGRLVDIHVRIERPERPETVGPDLQRMPFVAIYNHEDHEWYTSLDQGGKLHPDTLYHAGCQAERLGTATR